MSNKRYYWLRLHDDFFNSKRIKKLRRMAGGDTYTIIYLKLQLLAMKTEGYLKWTGLEDNVAAELALDIDESPEDIHVTLAYLISCGLAETNDDISFFFPYAVENTGSEGSSAKRMRDLRDHKASQCDALVAHCDTLVAQSDGEKEIEIEKRDIDRDIDREEKSKPVRHKYGEYKNVLLSDEDVLKLKTEFPSDWQSRIERLSSYIASTGKSYKNHLATIRNWARRDAQAQSGPGKFCKSTDTDSELPY